MDCLFLINIKNLDEEMIQKLTLLTVLNGKYDELSDLDTTDEFFTGSNMLIDENMNDMLKIVQYQALLRN